MPGLGRKNLGPRYLFLALKPTGLRTVVGQENLCFLDFCRDCRLAARFVAFRSNNLPASGRQSLRLAQFQPCTGELRERHSQVGSLAGAAYL